MVVGSIHDRYIHHPRRHLSDQVARDIDMHPERDIDHRRPYPADTLEEKRLQQADLRAARKHGLAPGRHRELMKRSMPKLNEQRSITEKLIKAEEGRVGNESVRK